MYNNSTFFIGVDLGDKHSYIVILDQDGELIESGAGSAGLGENCRFF